MKPPVGALITEIENVATVEKDVVRVKAKVKIEVLAEGWIEIPLRLSDAAITSATIGGQPARILGEPGQGYRLLVEKKGKQPEQIELALEYAKAIADARAEQRLVPDAAGAGQPVAGGDSPGGREGESVSADRGHRSAR